MLVVLVIISIITAVVITSHSAFNKTLLLANTAYDVALTIRSTATYGIGSRAAVSSLTTGYGVHFQSPPNNTFTLFADVYPPPTVSSACHPATDDSAPDAKPGNCVYDPIQSEKVTDYTLGNGMTISDFCTLSVGPWKCASDAGNALTALDIVFTRPNPMPFMTGCMGSACNYNASVPVTKACLKLTSPQGGERFISIALTGEINAAATSCP